MQGDRLTIKTTQPAKFFASVAQLVVAHRFAIERMQTLDSGAEAVFDYLERSAS
jgi:hypothetical protein